MASAAAVIPSIASGAAAAAEPAAWLMDERDGFISWLRGEFAAANAIIDLLVVHLRAVGDPGEYDHVAAAVQQRRHHWAPVIHMQQFFPVADVAFALRQAGWRRRVPPAQGLGAGASPSPPPPPPRRPAFSPSHHSHQHHRHGGNHRPDPTRGGGAVAAAGSEKDGREVHNREGKGLKEVENVVDAKGSRLDSPITDEGEQNPKLEAVSEGNIKVVATSVEHSTNEIIDGKTVNSVEGLKVYEGLVNVIETNKILSLANETKASYHRGGLEAGQTVIIGKRPMKGHGREIVQLGVHIIEGPPDDENQRETRVEAVPGLLHDLFDRLYQQEIIPFKPDYCVIDFFNEGDYSHPHHSPPWYGRPLCTLCLTDCDMVFGRAISGDRGDHRGPLKLSLTTGSLLLLQGKSADFAKRAIPGTRKQRILLNFGKSIPRKHIPAESASRFTPPLTPPPMPWGPSSRQGNMPRHPPSPKHFGYAPASGVFPAPAVGPHHIPPSDGMQPLFVAPAPVAAAAIPFTPAVPLPNTTAAWVPEATPRPAPPRFPGPGTGVFLPPGSGHLLPHQMMPASHGHGEPNSPQGSSVYLHNKSTGMEMVNGNLSPKSSPTKYSTTNEKPECNGSSNGGGSFVNEKSALGKELQNGGMKNVGNSKVQLNDAK
ncbi:RNA demethylase ALKBH10B-like [Phragmites australis]|uniref:RNA demethylase ALKBH10B-like n=1 Tax=Phragmites australis TaxID=29695 RepID=UPI002D789A41|nr:RNA demethylase ALKBH10B-like [Phragmites australis]